MQWSYHSLWSFSNPSISLFLLIRLTGLARHSRTNCTSLQQKQAGLKTQGSGGITLSLRGNEEDQKKEENGEGEGLALYPQNQEKLSLQSSHVFFPT